MDNFKIGFAQEWQKKYVEGALEKNNLTADFINISSDISGLLENLQQGNCDAIVVDFLKVPLVMPESLAITAVSERFTPNYCIFIRDEKKVENRILQLSADAKIFSTDNYLPFLLKEISTDFQYVSEESEADAIAFPSFLKEKYTKETFTELNETEFPPIPAQGVLAYICNKNDTNTRHFLKKIHHPEVAELTNIERSFAKICSKSLLGAYCEKDKMDNFHLWVAVVSDQEVIRSRVSSTTKFELAETAFKNINEY